MKEALKGTDVEAIKAKQEELQKDFYEMSSKMYQNAQGAPGAQDAQQNPGDNNAGGAAGGADYVDADYKEVDEDDKK